MNILSLLDGIQSVVPSYDIMVQAGDIFIGVVASAHIVSQLYLHAVRGYSDLTAPMLRAAFAVILLHTLPQIGQAVVHASTAISNAFGANDEIKILAQAILDVYSSIDMGWSFLTSVFSTHVILSLGTAFVIFLMILFKVIVLDIIQPIFFIAVLLWGVVGIPLSFVPGLGSMRGWIKMLIEIGLWPVVYQLLMTVLVVSFKTALLDTSHAIALLRMDESAYATVEDSSIQAMQSGALDAGGDLYIVLQFSGICVVAALTTLFIPMLCRTLVRGEAIGGAAGYAMSFASSFATGGSGRLLKGAKP